MIRFPIKRLLFVTAFGLLAAACSNLYSLVPRSAVSVAEQLAIVDVGVIMATGKTITDQVVSYQTGKDCSTVRLEQGRTYCREDEPNPIMSTKNCQRNLGDVTCYVANDSSSHTTQKTDQPQPQGSSLGR